MYRKKKVAPISLFRIFEEDARDLVLCCVQQGTKLLPCL